MSWVKEIKIVSSRSVVVATNKRQYKIRIEDCLARKIKKNQKLSKADRLYLKYKCACLFVGDYCLKQLSISQKSKAELKNKIKTKLNSWLDRNKIKLGLKKINKLIDIELNKLEDNKIIDDNQYLINYINRSKKKSNKQIEFELRHKGISGDSVRQALKLRENSETEIIKNLINKKIKNNHNLSFHQRSKLIASLIRRGFTINTIISVIDESQKKK